jgi:hypothetical protein
MTIDDYNKARDLVAQIEGIQNEIYDLKDIISNDTSSWSMEVRPNTAHSLKKVNHYGLLPEFLQAVLSKHLEKLHKLQSELDKL